MDPFTDKGMVEMPETSGNQCAFQENKIYTIKIHYFHFKVKNKEISIFS